MATRDVKSPMREEDDWRGVLIDGQPVESEDEFAAAPAAPVPSSGPVALRNESGAGGPRVVTIADCGPGSDDEEDDNDGYTTSTESLSDEDMALPAWRVLLGRKGPLPAGLQAGGRSDGVPPDPKVPLGPSGPAASEVAVDSGLGVESRVGAPATSVARAPPVITPQPSAARRPAGPTCVPKPEGVAREVPKTPARGATVSPPARVSRDSSGLAANGLGVSYDGSSPMRTVRVAVDPMCTVGTYGPGPGEPQASTPVGPLPRIPAPEASQVPGGRVVPYHDSYGEATPDGGYGYSRSRGPHDRPMDGVGRAYSQPRNNGRTPLKPLNVGHSAEPCFTLAQTRQLLREQAEQVRSIAAALPRTPSPSGMGSNGNALLTHLVQAKKKKDMTLERFEGDQDDWLDYKAQFDLVARHNEWTDQEKFQQLAGHLKGSAVSIYTDQAPKEFGELCDLLQQRFAPKNSEERFKNQFRNRLLQPDEEPEAYAQALSRLARRAFPNLNQGGLEDMVLFQFTTGLTDPKLKKRVSLARCKTKDEAVSVAASYLDYVQNQFPRLVKPVPRTGGAARAAVAQPLEAETPFSRRRRLLTCWCCGIEGHGYYQCPQNLDNSFRLSEEQRRRVEKARSRRRASNGNGLPAPVPAAAAPVPKN